VSRAPADRATVIVRYDIEAAGANPSAAPLKPMTIRFDRGGGWFPLGALVAEAKVTFVGARENVAPNGSNAIDVIVPEIVGPFPATKATDAPPICELVTVTTCVPTVGANVQCTDDRPLLSVVDVVALSDPPPTTVHASATPLTVFPAASITRTTSAESSAVARLPAWLLPDTMTMDVGVCGMVGESWQASNAAADNTTAVVAREFMK
jgi:hypothetical protein